jgi:succinylarginine dihydrolase
MTEVRVVVGPTNAVQVVDIHKSVAAAARVACERLFAVIVEYEYEWFYYHIHVALQMQ